MKFSRILIGTLLLLLIPTGALANGFTIWCGDLPGCEGGFPDFILRALTFAAEILPVVARYVASVFLVFGAMVMLLNFGDETRIESGKKTVMWSLGGLAIALFAEKFVYDFLIKQEFLPNVPGSAIMDNPIVRFLYALWLILFDFFEVALLAAVAFNAVRMVLSQGQDDQFAKAKNGLFWAAIGAIVFNVAGVLIDAVLGLPLQVNNPFN